MGLESSSNRAERLARLIQIWDRIPSLEETVSMIDAVTTSDVLNFADKMAHSAPVALALYGPVEGGPTLDAVQARRLS
jgi:predicted Zn-dependent peptidase